MATARRGWWKAACSLQREPFSNDELALLTRLSCELSDRWARDGLTPEQGCKITLTAGALCALAGRQRLRAARYTLSILAVAVSLRVTIDGSYTTIEWPKFAEFQGWATREPGNRGSKNAPSAHAPAHAPAEEEQEEEKTNASRSAADAAPRPPPADDPGRWVSILGAEPGTPEEKLAFVTRELPLAVAEAEGEHPRDRKAQRGKIKSVLIRHYRWQRDNPVPRHARSRDRPQTFHEISVENSKEAARDSLDFAEALVRRQQEEKARGPARIGAPASRTPARIVDVLVPRAGDGGGS